MIKDEFKKVLYKEKPIATKQDNSTEKDYFYTTFTSLGRVYFSVPVKDMGVLPFEDKIAAQLLIRWML